MTPRAPKLLRTHRQTAVILEHARVTLEGGRVVYHQAEDGHRKTFNIPFANVAVLFLGQGTSLSQPAARALAEEGVYVAFTGTGGAPLHMGDLTHYQVTGHMWKMIEVARDPGRSLEAARIIMRSRAKAIGDLPRKIGRDLMRKPLGMRFIDKDLDRFVRKIDKAASTGEVMAQEGAFAKAVYREFAAAAGMGAFTRRPGVARTGAGGAEHTEGAAYAAGTAGDMDESTRRANARIDHGNYIAYGIAGSCLWSLGVPHGLSVLHGKTRAGGLVFDLADSFKDALVLPLAFAPITDEREFRQRLIAAIQDTEILAHCHSVMAEILALAPGGPGGLGDIGIQDALAAYGDVLTDTPGAPLSDADASA